MGSSTATRPAPASGRAATGEPQLSGYQTLHQGTLGNWALATYLAGGRYQRHGQLLRAGLLQVSTAPPAALGTYPRTGLLRLARRTLWAGPPQASRGP